MASGFCDQRVGTFGSRTSAAGLPVRTQSVSLWRSNAERAVISEILHKLLGLAWVIYTAIVVYHSGRPVDSRAAFFPTLVVLAISMIALIATGSFLTVVRHENSAWLNVHRSASAIGAIAGGVTLHLLMLNGH